jgi:hypothetical protein
MSKKIRTYILASVGLIFGLLNLILFLTIPVERLSTFSFWFSWSFAFIINYLAILFVILYSSKIKKYEDITTPPSLYICGIFTLVYLILGFIFMYWKNISWKPVFVFEILTTIAYFITLFFVLIGTSYINNNNKKQKEKVFYIRDLASDVEYANSMVNNIEIKNVLNKLQEDIRFSDPMSHDSLARIEDELKELVFRLIQAAQENNENDLVIITKEIDLKLKYRNNKCINLK